MWAWRRWSSPIGWWGEEWECQRGDLEFHGGPASELSLGRWVGFGHMVGGTEKKQCLRLVMYFLHIFVCFQQISTHFPSFLFAVCESNHHVTETLTWVPVPRIMCFFCFLLLSSSSLYKQCLLNDCGGSWLCWNVCISRNVPLKPLYHHRCFRKDAQLLSSSCFLEQWKRRDIRAGS